MTERENGLENGKQVRALQPHEMFVSQRYVTAVYRSELALRLEKLGYELERGKHGQPEIKGYTKEYLEASSPRREQIKDHLREQGIDGAAAAQIAAHHTTSGKPRTRVANDVKLRFLLRTKSCKFISFLLILDTRMPGLRSLRKPSCLMVPATFERGFLRGDRTVDCTRGLWDTVWLSTNCQMRSCKLGGMMRGESEVRNTILANCQKAFLILAVVCRR